jgi:hypothetical protein
MLCTRSLPAMAVRERTSVMGHNSGTEIGHVGNAAEWENSSAAHAHSVLLPPPSSLTAPLAEFRRCAQTSIVSRFAIGVVVSRCRWCGTLLSGQRTLQETQLQRRFDLADCIGPHIHSLVVQMEMGSCLTVSVESPLHLNERPSARQEHIRCASAMTFLSGRLAPDPVAHDPQVLLTARPSGQVQVNMATLFVHVPQVRHGDEVHSVMSLSRGHAHMNDNSPSKHVPPLIRGEYASSLRRCVHV